MENNELNQVEENVEVENTEQETKENVEHQNDEELKENTEEVVAEENKEETNENGNETVENEEKIVESKESVKESAETEQIEEEKDNIGEIFENKENAESSVKETAETEQIEEVNDNEETFQNKETVEKLNETVEQDEIRESKTSDELSHTIKSKSSISTTEEPSKSSTNEEEDDLQELQERFIAVRGHLNLQRDRRTFLIKKLVEYFRKKKMDYVLENANEIKTVKIKQLDNYCAKLDAFNELSEKSTAEIDDINYNIEQATIEHDTKVVEINSLTDNWLQREKEIGVGLVYAKTGKQISEQTVNDFIKQQRLHLKLIEKLRTTLITLEDKILDIKNELQRMDVVGNMQFLEFEELKMENIAFVDKIEEREEEIARLRKRCQGAIQTLAHVKEKCNALDTDKMLLTEKLNELDEMYKVKRGELNDLKKRRDFYRTSSNKIHADGGLLTQPMLLRDMEESLNEYTVKLEEMNRLKEDNEKLAKEIRALRKNIERTTASLTGKDVKKSVVSAMGLTFN